MLLDTGASVSITDLALPITNRTNTFEGLGGCVTFHLSEPIPLTFPPLTKVFWVQIWVGPSNLGSILGMDLMSMLECSILLPNQVMEGSQFSTPIPIMSGSHKGIAALTETNTVLKLLMSLFPNLWSTDKLAVGHIPIEPVRVSGPMHNPVRQYPLKRTAEKGAKEIVDQLEVQGVIKKCVSPTNSPMWPVPKPDGSWRLTIDYTALNKVTTPRHAIVANPTTLLSQLNPSFTIFSALDVSNGFFSVPIDQRDQVRFAFTCDGQQYTFTRLPQGYLDSPTIFHQALAQVLRPVQSGLSSSSIILQYCDDILLASNSPEEHLCVLTQLCEALQENGLLLNAKKAQCAVSEVTYMGQRVGRSGRRIIPERVKAVLALPRPTTITGVREVMGMFNYIRVHIPDFADISRPLVHLMKGGLPGSAKIEWSTEADEAFMLLKQAMASSPVLAHPDPDQPFHLWAYPSNTQYSSILCQLSARHQKPYRPIGYFSCKTPPALQGQPTCIQTLDCFDWALKASEPYTGFGTVVLHTQHRFVKLLGESTIQTISPQRRGRWETSLFDPRVSITTDDALLFKNALTPTDGEQHDCDHEMIDNAEIFVGTEPIPDGRAVFVDGSSFMRDGERLTGWAAVGDGKVLRAGKLYKGGAQVAELVAVTNALQLALHSNVPVNIFTDSAYAYHSTHTWGPVWKSRNFTTAAGAPIAHKAEIITLSETLTHLTPSKCSVIKITGHSEQTKDALAQGNDLADKAAKKAAEQTGHSRGVMGDKSTQHIAAFSCTELISLQDLQKAYPTTNDYFDKMMTTECAFSKTGLWIMDEKVVMPTPLVPILLRDYHQLAHTGVSTTCSLVKVHWYVFDLVTEMEQVVKTCIHCAKTAPYTHKNKIIMGHDERPTRPFTHLQIDFVGPLPKSEGYEYLLVCIDRFSRWVEGFPCRRATADAVAKALYTHILPRWGFPLQIDSDQGSHFTGRVLKTILKNMGIHQKLHIPYRPQSSGYVESHNRVLKSGLKARLEQHGGKWTAHLPVVLLMQHNTPNRTTGLSPAELLFGRNLILPNDPILTDEVGLDSHRVALEAYCQTLSKVLRDKQLLARIRQDKKDHTEVATGRRMYQEGQKVMLKKFGTQAPLQSAWKGPYVLIMLTETSCFLSLGNGRHRWAHLSQIKPFA